MKQIIIATQLLIITFLFCSCDIPYETKETENVSSTIQTVASSTSCKCTTETETSLQINENSNDFFLNNIMDAIIDKDEDELWRIGYIEGENGFLYNVNFKSYEILNNFRYRRYDGVKISVYLVKLVISDSSDIRFPNGTSIWNVGISEAGFCTFFLPETIDEQQISEYYNNKYAQIGRYYTFSFPEYNNIKDTKTLANANEKKAFEDGIKDFVIGLRPELRNGGEVLIEKTTVNEVLKQYLDIEDCNFNDNTLGIKCDSNRWQSETVYALINEQCNKYIDVTYYADFAYITPAYKIRYYFNNENNPLNLTEVKIIEDYGYNPFTSVF